jgi:hypothetical protein
MLVIRNSLWEVTFYDDALSETNFLV